MKFKKAFITAGALAASLTLSSGCTPGDSSPWIWNIEGNKITIKQFENAYENYLDLMAMQFQMSTDQLKQLIEDPEMVQEPRMKAVLQNLNKEAYAEQYRTMVLLTMEAEKSGFIKTDENRSKLEFFNQYYTAMLFMNGSIDPESIVVTDDDAIAYWEEIRKKYPQYKQVPISEGVEVAKQQIVQERLYVERQEMTKSILESYKIEKNKEFNLQEYLSQKSAKSNEEEAGEESNSQE